MRIVNVHRYAKLVYSTIVGKRFVTDGDAIAEAKAEMVARGVASAPFTELVFTVRTSPPKDNT